MEPSHTLSAHPSQTIEPFHFKQFGKDLELRSKSKQTVESYRSDAEQFVKYLVSRKIHPLKATSDTLIEYQSYLQEIAHEKANTVRRAVIGVRQFYRFLVRSGHLPYSEFDDVSIPERQEKLPALDFDKIGDLIRRFQEQAQQSYQESRNAAILTLLGIEGIKVTELLGLQWSDLLADELRIKGSRSRSIRLEAESLDTLTIYQGFHKRLLEGRPSTHHQKMFVAFKGRDQGVMLPAITRHGLKFIIYEIGERYQIDQLNSEQLRHHAIHRRILSGTDPEILMKHLGIRRAGNISKHMAALRHASTRG